MAHFAELNENNIVTQVIVIDNQILLDEQNIEQEQFGIDFCKSLFGAETSWKQTSYNATFRKNFAGIGYEYRHSLDAFIPPKLFNSWILNEYTCRWEAPIAYPEDGKIYFWNEDLVLWERRDADA